MTVTAPLRRRESARDDRPSGFDLPPTPRRSRNLAGVLLGVLVVVGCAAGVGLVVTGADHRTAVLVVRRPLSAGAIVRDADLGEVRVSVGPSVSTVPATARARVVGRTTAARLTPGMLVADADLAQGPGVGSDEAVVGVSLHAGQSPSTFSVGDRVMIVRAGSATLKDASPGSGTSPVLVPRATVLGVGTAPDGQSQVASVVLPLSDAPTVAVAAAAGDVALVVLGSGR